MLVSPQDTAILAGGLTLICSIYGVMLARGAQKLRLEDEVLIVGDRRIPWNEVQGVTLSHGLDTKRLQVHLDGGALEVTPKMIDEPLDKIAEAIVQRAELIAGAPKLGKPGHSSDRVSAWVQALSPEDTEGLREGASEVSTEDPGLPLRQVSEKERKAKKAKKAKKSAVGAGALFLAVASKLSKFGILGFQFGVKGLKLAKLGPTALSMMATVWIYAQLWGWVFAVGFVALLFVHEIGHAIIIASKGIRTSPILFVPFVGAVIGIKDQFRDASVEAETALGGPALGGLGATLCFLAFLATDSEFWLAIAYTGFFLNLFNLLPVSPLDGGRIVTAISTKLWIVGLLATGYWAFHSGHPILILVVILGALRAWKTWRGKRAGEPQTYFETRPSMRIAMSLAYFGLAGFLGYMMQWSLSLLEHAA